ncbi:MAG: hypothetical protein IJ455_05360 [Agathobacter sp.]|nr:hypothetical protein [Agathobacter sp.]
MVWTEIVLIILGVAMIFASFYVTEKLSQQDLEHISMMSEADLKKVAEKQVKDMRGKVETELETILDESLEVVQRGLEKETNKKIMAVSEYSETVLESINKSHNEITFLYSMLNDKQAEAAQLVNDLQKVTKQIRDLDLENTIAKAETVASNIPSVEKGFEPIAAPIVEAPEMVKLVSEATPVEETPEVSEETPVLSKNEQILLLYKEGKEEVEIAKTLDCGLGEVRLVLGLYNNEA